MKIIEPSVEILEYPEATDEIAVYKFLEKIGRTCYKSEDRITEDSYKKMIDNLIKNKHTSVLEHYTYVTELNENEYNQIQSLYNLNPYANFLKLTNVIYHPHESLYQNNYLLSYSLGGKINLEKFEKNEILLNLINRIHDHNYHLTQNEIMNLAIDEQLIHRYMTVKFICDRGIMAELTRHRIASFSVESTRYANYSLDKFGNEITVIYPFNKTTVSMTAYERWLKACKTAEDIYMKLTTDHNDANENGTIPPELARSVLPNSLKTEVVMTAPFWSWKHFFDIRMHPRAHPQMQSLVKMLYDKLVVDPKYKVLVDLIDKK